MGIWTDERERDGLREALVAAWPGGSPPALRWLNEGFGSAAFESDDGLVVLVAKNAIGAHSRHVTCALTPALAPRVPVAIPQPVWRIEAAPGLPFGAYAYPKLPGRPWTREEAAAGRGAVARQIAGFLHGVHAYPVDRAVDAGIPSFDEFWADIVSLRSSTDNAVKQHLPAFEYARVKEWWDAFLSDSLLQEAPRRLVHGDLWRHNLLVDETAENLTGVLDFGDLAIVDVSYDFVFFLEPGGDLLESCRAAYEGLGGGLDPGFEHRFNRWWELRSGSWFSIRAAVRTGDQAVLEDSLQELRTSQIFRSPDSISGKM